MCFGKGDLCVVDFVRKLEAGDSDYLNTPNMAFNDGGKQIINGVLPPFKDLDSLPFHDFSVVNSFVIDKDILPLTKDLIRSFFPTVPVGKNESGVLYSDLQGVSAPMLVLQQLQVHLVVRPQ